MKTLFRNIMAIIALVVIVYGATNYSGSIEQKIGIKNSNANNAKGIAGQVLGDATSQVSNAAKNFNLTAFVSGLPQDITSVKNFAQAEFSGVIKSRGKK